MVEWLAVWFTCFQQLQDAALFSRRPDGFDQLGLSENLTTKSMALQVMGRHWFLLADFSNHICCGPDTLGCQSNFDSDLYPHVDLRFT